jgi:hypothetical protein
MQVERKENDPMASMTVDTGKQAKGQILAAVMGTACVLAVAAGAVAWQGLQARDETAPAPQVSQHAKSAAPAPLGYRPDEDFAADSPLGNIMPTTVRRTLAVSTFYLVGTREAADALQAMIDRDANLVRAENNEPPMPAAVGVADSAEDAHRLLMTIAHADALNAELGLPPLQVVDLRTP